MNISAAVDNELNNDADDLLIELGLKPYDDEIAANKTTEYILNSKVPDSYHSDFAALLDITHIPLETQTDDTQILNNIPSEHDLAINDDNTTRDLNRNRDSQVLLSNVGVTIIDYMLCLILNKSTGPSSPPYQTSQFYRND